MSIYTAEWFEVEPFFYHWDNRTDCEYFLKYNLIREDGFIYGCAEDDRSLTIKPEDV